MGQDIGIATFLMLLWKQTFGPASASQADSSENQRGEPWRDWPRPPAGFLDLGYVCYQCYIIVATDVGNLQVWQRSPYPYPRS